MAFAVVRGADPGDLSLQENITDSLPHSRVNVSTGYDSLYMYKGLNVLPGDGIGWFRFDPVWQQSAVDLFDIPFWYAFALGTPLSGTAQNYEEFDVPLTYTRKLGDFSLIAAYDLYFYYNTPGLRPSGEGIQHELHLGSFWTKTTGAVTWKPAIDYFYELGNASGTPYGCVNPGSSFLGTSMTCSIPVIGERVTFDPMAQYNFSFGYSVDQSLGHVWGGNNAQITLPLTWHLCKAVSLSCYGAYSYQWQQLLGTSPGTVWGGGSLNYSF